MTDAKKTTSSPPEALSGGSGVSIPNNRPGVESPQSEALPAPVRDLADLLARLAADHILNQAACGQ